MTVSKVDRKIIYKCYTGSHLYGTNTPKSDNDFIGVFLPGTDDLISLENCPSEWTFNDKQSNGPRNEAGDVDCKFFSLQKFINLALQGQPAQLEMLFCPKDKVLIATPEWELIIQNREHFLSVNGIRPFVGFALAQSHKASIKGENLAILKNIQSWGQSLQQSTKKESLTSVLDIVIDSVGVVSGYWGIINTDIKVKALRNDFGALLVEIAGRQFDVGVKIKDFLSAVDNLVERYGTRSELAMVSGYDYKSLMHAFRLLSEAEEFLATGKITMPRPDAEYLKAIREGRVDIDFNAEITLKLDNMRQHVEPKSPLPSEPNRSTATALYQKIILEHLK